MDNQSLAQLCMASTFDRLPQVKKGILHAGSFYYWLVRHPQ